MMHEKPELKEVFFNDYLDVQKIAVEGGWLYITIMTQNVGISTTFVAEDDAAKRDEALKHAKEYGAW